MRFRTKVLLDIGGFEIDTLSEDFDIGLKIHKSGWKVQMSRSVMHTNVPQTLSGIGKTEDALGRGTFQVIKKHKDMVFNQNSGGLDYMDFQIKFISLFKVDYNSPSPFIK